jgi:hypothetical protein
MGYLYGPEKMNNTCRKTMHMEPMDRGITVLESNEKITFCHVQFCLCQKVSKKSHKCDFRVNHAFVNYGSFHPSFVPDYKLHKLLHQSVFDTYE